MKSSVTISLRGWWLLLRSSFWFIPALMALGSFALALLMIYLDQTLDHDLMERYPTLLAANAAGARSILSAIAGSMITVAGVTFSITIVALSLASNQYTPRILRNFMSDTANQVVLGAFVSVFIYSLVVLRAIRGGEESFIPSYGLLVGMILAFIGIGFLIFFVHHISTMVQASTILANIHLESMEVIDQLYPAGAETNHGEKSSSELQTQDEQSRTVPSPHTGYIQDTDEQGLIVWAERNNAVVEMLAGIGEFIAAGAPLLRIHGGSQEGDTPASDLVKCFGIAQFRTIKQDPAFGIRQIVDVALKALSPGINDTTTAASCLDYLGALLFELSKRNIPPRERCKNGRVRLISCGASFQTLADLSYHEIRQHARNNVSIYVKLLSTIEKVFTADASPENISIFWEHAMSVAQTADSQIQSPTDRELINRALRRTAKAFGKDFQQVLLPEHSFPSRSVSAP